MEIIEPKTDESNEVTIILDIPYKITLFGVRRPDEYRRTAIQILTGEIGILLDHIDLVVYDLENEKIKSNAALEIVGVMARLGSGIAETIEEVNNSFQMPELQ